MKPRRFSKCVFAAFWMTKFLNDHQHPCWKTPCWRQRKITYIIYIYIHAFVYVYLCHWLCMLMTKAKLFDLSASMFLRQKTWYLTFRQHSFPNIVLRIYFWQRKNNVILFLDMKMSNFSLVLYVPVIFISWIEPKAFLLFSLKTRLY